MASVNKVTLIGNLGRDPELRYTNAGTATTTLSIATTHRYKNKSDQMVEQTEWHRVVVWGKQAESCNQYLSKGRQVYIEGRLQTRDYEDRNGTKKYVTEIVAEVVQFLGGRPGESNQRSEPAAGGSNTTQREHEYVPSEPGDDDIPF